MILDLKVNSRRFTLIYGPNTDKPIFYENIFKIIDDIENEAFICCGDLY